MAVVTLDAAAWRELFPAFATATDAQVGQWFALACMLVDNSDHSAVPYDPPARLQRQAVIDLAMCHLATLAGRGDTVGRVSSAGQGSVNTGMDYQAGAKNAAWWTQTQCGATAWQLLKPYRVGGAYFHGRC